MLSWKKVLVDGLRAVDALGMDHQVRYFCAFLWLVGQPVHAGDWPQGGGPEGSFVIEEAKAPVQWSVVRDEGIAWRVELPETGQSPVVVAKGLAFFSHYVPVEKDSTVGHDIVACCVDANTGEMRWQREIPGRYNLRLSGCFSDSTSPPAVVDGDRVCFVNASGTIACFDLGGNPLWSEEILTAGRMIPFLHDGKIVIIRQVYPPDESGNFTHEYAEAPLEKWTQLQALEMTTGEAVWTSECGVNMGCLPLPQTRSDGKVVAVVGRGGGHGPPEKPEGISMVDLKNGSSLWSLTLDGFMSTMSFSLHEGSVIVYHLGECLKVDEMTGGIRERISILKDIPSRVHRDGAWEDEVITIPDGGKGREITQGSNLLVGDYSFFRNYQRNLLGRVNLKTNEVEYLMLPVQVLIEKVGSEVAMWGPEDSIPTFKPAKKPRPLQLNEWAIRHNTVKNSRGMVVMGDDRSQGNGWGHIASPSPMVVGEHLYVTSMSGNVYVIRWTAERLDETSLVAINDLGPLGDAWTRASLTFSNGRLFAHTIREVIAIGD